MAVDKVHSAPADSEERTSKEASSEEQVSGVPRWLVVTAVLALTGVAIVIVYGYLARPKPDWIGVANKNVWDWLDLLVVPAALAVGVYWLNTRQAARQQREEDQRQAREEAAQEAQIQHALEVEDQRAQDAALQAYLDQMSHLLTDAERPLHRAELYDSLSTVARARTLAVLPRLDGVRKRSTLEFLYESGLIRKDRLILELRNADLSGAYLYKADLREADLVGAYLYMADLSNVDLMGAYLMLADLSEATLSGANLSEATLSGANLSEATLSGANLSEATGWTEEQLEQAESLEGATMPNGQKYEDWLKDKKAQGRDEKNE